MSDLRIQAYRDLLVAIELHLRLFGVCDEAPEVWLELARDSMREVLTANLSPSMESEVTA